MASVPLDKLPHLALLIATCTDFHKIWNAKEFPMSYNCRMEEFVGTWWHPDKPERAIGGILTIDERGKSILRLAGSLFKDRAPSDWPIPEDYPLIVERDEVPPIILGRADGKFVTLLHPFCKNISSNGGQDCTTDVQTLEPIAVILNIHLNSPDENIFQGIEVEIENLTEWANMSGSSKVFGDNGELRQEMKFVDSNVSQSGEFKISLNQIRSSPGRDRKLTEIRLELAEKIILDVSRDESGGYTDYNSSIRRIQDLLTFATRRSCAIRSRTLYRKDGDESRSYRVHIRESVYPAQSDSVKRQIFLFHLSDTSFSELISSWDKLYDAIGLGVNVVLGLDYMDDRYFENSLFDVASAIEAIHRRLCSDSPSLDPSGHEKIIKTLKDNLTADLANWAASRLKNEPGYRSRAKALARIPDQKAIADLLGDTDRWSKWLCDSRNSIAHLDLTGLHKIPEEARYHLAYVTAALLHLVFLEKLGFDSEVQQKAVTYIYGYRSGVFREACMLAAGTRQAELTGPVT